MSGCIFCRIAAGEIPAKIDFQDDRTVAFQDTAPKAPVHVLVIPRRHIESLGDGLEDESLLGHLLAVAARIAREKGIDGTGYRAVVNTGAAAGQSVFHLHVHVMGGRTMHWPPG